MHIVKKQVPYKLAKEFCHWVLINVFFNAEVHQIAQTLLLEKELGLVIYIELDAQKKSQLLEISGKSTPDHGLSLMHHHLSLHSMNGFQQLTTNGYMLVNQMQKLVNIQVSYGVMCTPDKIGKMTLFTTKSSLLPMNLGRLKSVKMYTLVMMKKCVSSVLLAS